MAQKFFIATCPKKRKHPIDDKKVHVIPVEAKTQEDAKELARKKVEALDSSFEESGESYKSWYTGPYLEKVTEEEFNAACIETEASELDKEQIEIPTSYPALGNDGFYDEKDADVSRAIYNNTGENMQAAKVFILNVGKGQWSQGFHCKFGNVDKHERMNLDRIEPTRKEAINAAIDELQSYAKSGLNFVDDNQKLFLNFVIDHDFHYEFLIPSEKFATALYEHPDYKSASHEHPNFLEVTESHFASVWPLDKSPQQAIEHVQSMQTIGVLYDLQAFTESMKPYLPAVIPEAAKESMTRIEKTFSQAANDESFAETCTKAVIEIREGLHVVLAIKNDGDAGWRSAYEIASEVEVLDGDCFDFGDAYSANRKEAIKSAGQKAVDALYNFDISLTLAKVFMKKPYIQLFDENCVEVEIVSCENEQPKHSPLEAAIRARLAERPSAKFNQSEVDMALSHVTEHLAVDTDIESLIQAIGKLEHCAILFNSKDAGHLVAAHSTIENQAVETTHNKNNKHECFIAEILSRVGDDGSAVLTAEQYEEAGDKLSAVVDECIEHHGKALNIPATLSNIAGKDWESSNEVCKTFLNLRSIRATFRDYIELNEQGSTSLNVEYEHPALFDVISTRIDDEDSQGNAYTRVIDAITQFEQDNISVDLDALCDHIKTMKNPIGIIMNVEVINLVRKFTTVKEKQMEDKQEDTKEVVNNEPKHATKIKETATSNTAPEPDSNVDTANPDNDSSDIPQDILEKEPVNESSLIEETVDEKLTQLEGDWSEDEHESVNMRIWSQVHRTDREFTSKDHKGFTSINTQYRIMQMTKVFGVCGFGWGYDEIERWEAKGAQLSDGTFEEYVHIRIALWVKIDGVKSEPITHYGSTKSRYLTSGYGGKVQSIVQDEDPYKKAESDALGKAMSMLGVCADVYLGEHDDQHIETLSMNVAESAKKVRHLEEEESIRKEVNEKVASIVEEMQEQTTKSGINTLRAKALHIIDALPDINSEQKRKKSGIIQKLEVRYHECLNAVSEEQERKKQEKKEA